MSTSTVVRLDILGWMFELYSDDQDYEYYSAIDSNRSDFEKVYDIWVEDDSRTDELIDSLFEKVLSDLGLKDYGDTDWFYNTWRLRD